MAAQRNKQVFAQMLIFTDTNIEPPRAVSDGFGGVGHFAPKRGTKDDSGESSMDCKGKGS